MTATHGRPRDLTLCGLTLIFRHATVEERMFVVTVGGYLFTCPKHGQVYMDVFVS